MKNCEFKKGIFIKQSCHQISNQKCKKCDITVCRYHSKKHSDGSLLCSNCYINREKWNNNDAREHYMQDDSGYYLWYASSTNNYRSHYGHAPFDESDYDSFESPVAEGGYFDEHGEDDFFDS